MGKWIRWGIAALAPVGLLFFALPEARAAQEAEMVDGMEAVVEYDGFGEVSQLFDENDVQAVELPEGASITLSHPQGIASAYLIFDTDYDPYTVTDVDSGVTLSLGEKGFLHEFVDLEKAFGTAPDRVEFLFPGGGRLNEIYLFTPGEVPDFVEKWREPKAGKTDLLLFSAHGDDEQLFFAGLLPYYAGEMNYEVLVAYLTDHRNMGTLRRHEMLNGLWAAGVTTYPVFGWFGDYYSKSKESAYEAHSRAGESREALLGYVVEQLRRFRPQVAVGHDVNGEYGHGQHRMYAELLCQGVEAAGDPEQYPELTAQWGTWDVPKTYLHLWPENQITMDWDKPLARFDGMTAFQVSQQLGFPCHKSQYGGFAWYIAKHEHAADIPKYSPCEYGLYRTKVGPDEGEGDFFENLSSYAQQEAAAAMALMEENARKAREAARQAAMEQQRQAKIQEENRRMQLQAEAERLEKQRNILGICGLVFAGAAVAAVWWTNKKRDIKKI